MQSAYHLNTRYSLLENSQLIKANGASKMAEVLGHFANECKRYGSRRYHRAEEPIKQAVSLYWGHLTVLDMSEKSGQSVLNTGVH